MKVDSRVSPLVRERSIWNIPSEQRSVVAMNLETGDLLSHKSVNSRLQKYQTMATKKHEIKYKKAPGAPRRFKSAFMFFSEYEHRLIRQRSGGKKVSDRRHWFL